MILTGSQILALYTFVRDLSERSCPDDNDEAAEHFDEIIGRARELRVRVHDEMVRVTARGGV